MDLPNGWNPNCLQRPPDRPVYLGIAVDVSKLPPLFSLVGWASIQAGQHRRRLRFTTYPAGPMNGPYQRYTKLLQYLQK